MFWRFGIVVLISLNSVLLGQTAINLATQGRDVDFSSSAFTRPVSIGSALPPTCQTGQLFFNTATANGSNLYGCTSPASWTVLGGFTLPPAGTSNLGGVSVPSASGLTITGSGALSVNFGTVAGSAAAGNDSRIANALQPTSLIPVSNITGLARSATTDATNASNISSGTLSSARLPTPSASALGGIESYGAVSHQWINSISTAGAPTSSQPAFSDIAGSLGALQLPALTGDTTTAAGSAVTTTARVNGTSVPVNSSSDQTIVTTAPATASWASLPNCLDSSGQHLNYNVSTHAFSCGTTGASIGSVPFSALSSATNTSAAMLVGSGASLAPTGTGTLTANAYSGQIADANLPSDAVRTGAGATFGAYSYDFSAASTRPLQVGTISGLPATCAVGQLYFATNATAGQQIYECSSSNNWTQQLNSGTGSSPAFSALTGGTNSTAAMLVGTGASLAPSGSGTITANGYSGTLSASNMPAFTGGDATSSSGSTALTLNSVNGSSGTCGDATHVCQITTNTKGLVTGQSSVAITGAGSTITTFDALLPMGGCPASGTPALAWDAPASGNEAAAAGCSGTNVNQAYASFANSGTPALLKTIDLPPQFVSTNGADVYVKYLTATASGTFTLALDVSCTATTGTATNDPSWTANNFFAPGSQTAPATANQVQTISTTGISWPSGCAAGSLAHLRLIRTDTTGTASSVLVTSVTVVGRRTL